MKNIRTKRYISLFVVSLLSAITTLFAQKNRANSSYATSDSPLTDTDSYFSDYRRLLENDTIFSYDETFIDTLNFKSYVPSLSPDLLQDRISCVNSTIPLTYNKTVAGFVNFFMVRKRNYTQTMLERKAYYFPIFEKYLKEYGLPDELKYLSVVESGLSTHAVSRSGATGLWQFMPPTGKDFKLHQDFYLDERMDPHKATEAACKYLKYLYSCFGDWELALAAYNCGQGTIKKVLKRTGKKTFWEIYNHLPQETRSYVPWFTAAVYALNFANDHNIYPDADSVLTHIEHDTVRVNGFLTLDLISRSLGVDYRSLKHLNPVLRRSATPHNGNYVLRIPAEKKVDLVQKMPSLLDSAAKIQPKYQEKFLATTATKPPKGKKTYYEVQAGDGLSSIAAQYQIKIADLKAWNRLNSNKIKAGQRLVIWAKPGAQHLLANKADSTKDTLSVNKNLASKETNIATDTTSKTNGSEKGLTAELKNAQANNADSLATVSTSTIALKIKAKPAAVKKVRSENIKTYQVQPGDTLWAISQKYPNLSVEEIIRKNNLKGKSIKPGQKLIVG